MSNSEPAANDRKLNRIRTFAALTGVGLSVGVIEMGALGAIDASTAATFGGRITGVTFLFSAMLALAGTFAIFTYSNETRGPSYSAAAVLIGVAITGLMNFGLLILQFEAGDYTPYLWVWISLVSWSCWTLFMLRRRGIWKRIPQPKKFAVGALLTGIIAATNFTYTQIYKPSTQPSKVELNTSFGKPSITPDGKSVALPLNITLANTGDVSLFIAASTYQATARKAHASAARTMKDWLQDIDEFQYDFRRDVDVDGYDLIQSGPVEDAGIYLDPGDKTTESKVIEIPLNSTYDVILARSEAVILRKDKVSLSSDFASSEKDSWDENDQHSTDVPAWVDPDTKDEFIEYRAPLTENSAILKAIRSKKNLTVWWILAQPAQESEFGPYTSGVIASMNHEGHEPSSRETDQASERYGLAFLTSGAAQESFGAVRKSLTG
ncbi:hypothetical protein ABT404_24955 [Streptomyces hyaluromycini]|uniref:Uncharacterized protein n=1 Tax=Streptomyces hyaluromycini TaxID=1377993 RepID=A0ABV1X102_9ACTN